jgi:hypothetical protein
MRARERSDESGFAVVYMTGSADNTHDLFRGFSSVAHDSFVGGQPLVEDIHEFLKLLLGGISRLVHQVLNRL